MRKRDLEAELADLKEQIERQDVSHEIQLHETTAFMRQLAKEQTDGNWTSLDRAATKRNRTFKDVEENLKDAYEAWCVNPIAKSFVDYMRYFVIGKGTHITTEDDAARERITAFCEWNEWEVLEKAICEELSRDGEVFVRFHDINKFDVKSDIASISLIDPLEIQAIDCKELNNPTRYLRAYTKLGQMDDAGNQGQESVREWIPAEEIHHIKVNTSHNELRGRSDLLVVLPWLKQLRRWIEDMSRRNYFSGAFVWDVTTKGAIKPSTVTGKYPTGPMPGSVIAHTEAEEWNVNAPDMRWGDSTNGARAIKLLVMAGYKMPESWFGDTGESNLATTQALAMPTLRAFLDRQDFLKYHYEQIISRGARVEDVDVTFPELETEEANVKAQALLSLSSAVINFQTAGVLSRESAYNVVKGYIEELDEWEDDTSGVGEKLKIEREEAEDVAATAAGRKVAGQTRLVPPPLEGEGAPVLPPLET